VTVTPIGDPGSTEISPIDACRECAKSLSRWVDRGRSRTRIAAKPRPPKAEKMKPSRRDRFRPSRQQIALGVVILLALLFGYFISRGSGQ
jgi:hypothetical protein